MTRRLKWYGPALFVTASVPARAQSTAPAIPVPATIRPEGVPPIPASVRPSLNRYQNIRSASFQDWASDGSGMYVITRFADVPQVHFVAAAGGARMQLTFLHERVLSVSARRVTDGKSRNMAPKWSPSGSLLAWSSNTRNGRDMDIYVAAPTDPHFVRRVKEVSGQWTVSDWSPDETRIAAVDYLVDELGLVLIFPNVRGSSGYGKTYLQLDHGKLRGDAVKDIGALLDWIKAGIDIVGISSFVSLLKNTQDYRRRAEYGDERDPAMRSFLERISPLWSAGKIRTPFLIVQGQNDPRVPISESEQMVAALRKNKVPVWYVVGTNEGHGFAKKANHDSLQAVEVEFLRRYLVGMAR